MIRHQAAPTAWQTYQTTTLARTDLTPNLRSLFRALASCGNYKNACGGDCAPLVEDLAKACGWSVQWTARQLRRLRALGIIETVPLRSRSGRWNRNGYRFIGDGFASPATFDNMEWLQPSKTPRRGNQAHDRATGRFTNGPKVTIGDGPKVTIGHADEWSDSYQSDLAFDSDPALDPARSASAPEAVTNSGRATTKITSALRETMPTSSAVVEMQTLDAWRRWWELPEREVEA